MSSFYDGQPPPPSRKERIARDGTVSYQAKQLVDRYVPLYFEPNYNRPPRSKLSETVFLALVLTILVVVASWGFNTLDSTYPDDVVARIPAMEVERDRQMAEYEQRRPWCDMTPEQYEAYTQEQIDWGGSGDTGLQRMRVILGWSLLIVGVLTLIYDWIKG